MLSQKERRSQLRIRRITMVSAGVAVLAVLFAVVVFFYLYFFQGNPLQAVQPSTKLGGMVAVNSSQPQHSSLVTKNRQQIYEGNLILVNHDTEYRLENEEALGSIYDLRSKSYKSQDTTLLLNKEVIQELNTMMDAFYSATQKNDCMVASGYRSRALQEDLYQRDLGATGQSVSQFVTPPGHSEHHTGLSFDMGLWPTNGANREFDGTGDYSWFAANSYRYGFVIRYASDKVDITKIGNEPWHFRYVGIPHAYVMMKENLCLEEYISYVKRYSYEGSHLMVTTDDNKKYEIYYVALPEGKDTVDIPVPASGDYEISGNNEDGFIVTVPVS